LGRRSGAVDEGVFGAWQVAGYADVECLLAVLEQLRAEAVDAFRTLPHGGMETGGVLFGVEQPGAVRITAYVPLACEHAFGPGFALSAKDESALQEVLAGNDPRLAGVRCVGWYRSRTRGDVPLSARDFELHARYFPEPWQVVLVLWPEASSVARATFFALAPEGGFAGGEELVLRPASRRRPEREPDLRVVPAAPRPAPARSVPPRNVPPNIPPPEIPAFLARAEASPHRPTDWRWLVMTFVFLFVALAVAGFSYGSRTAPPGPPDIGLRALDVKGQLLITWDRHAQPALESRRAVLEIADGPRRIALDLDHESATRGSVTYVRQSGRVDLRMKMYRARDYVAECVSFVGEAAETNR
jgi:hypothetical protein